MSEPLDENKEELEETGAFEEEPKNKSHKVGIIIAVCIIAVLTIGLSVVGMVIGKSLHSQMTVFPNNIVIDTVDIGGLTPEGAKKAVLNKMKEQADQVWNFHSDKGEYRLKACQLINMPKDVDALVDQAWEAETSAPFTAQVLRIITKESHEDVNYDIPIEYNNEAMVKAVADWHENWDTAPVNSTMYFQGSEMVVTPASSGYTVDETGAFDDLPENFAEIEPLDRTIALVETKPTVTEDSFKEFTQLSTYSTNYNPGETGRTHNLEVACSKINGKVLNPGETFSFNGVVGQRTEAAGFQTGMVISGGDYKPEIGGGICQVASTVYNAALLSGMEIVERANHALKVSYVPDGRDATVYYGSQDFKFRNSSTHPIYIGTSIGGGTLTVSIYGNPADKKNISITTSYDSTYVVRAYRHYLDANGNTVSTQELPISHYQPHNTSSQATSATPAPAAETKPAEETPAAEPAAEPVETTTEEASPEPVEEPTGDGGFEAVDVPSEGSSN